MKYKKRNSFVRKMSVVKKNIILDIFCIIFIEICSCIEDVFFHILFLLGLR